MEVEYDFSPVKFFSQQMVNILDKHSVDCNLQNAGKLISKDGYTSDRLINTSRKVIHGAA